MGRISEWESVYNYLMKSSRVFVFEWGKNDCILWSMMIVEAITGKDYTSKHRGKYRDKKSADAYLKKLGKSLDKIVDAKFKRIKAIEAGRGDLVFYQGAVGICDGLYSFFMKEPGGLVPIKTVKCSAAWRVG